MQVRRVHDARREAREHVRRAVAERELRDLLAVDGCAADPRGRVQQRRVRHDDDRFGNGAGFHRDVNPHDVADVHVIAGPHDFLETRELRGDRVRAGIEIPNLVQSLSIRDGRQRDARLGIGDRDGNAREDAASRVRDRARDPAAKLLCRHGRRQQGEDDRDQPAKSCRRLSVD